MGSFDFTTIAAGKTAQEAFQAARSQDAAEYGYDSYTGTLGQKDSFITFSQKPLTDLQARKMLAENFYYQDQPVRKGDRVQVSYYDKRTKSWNDFSGTVLAKRGDKFRVQPDRQRYEYRSPDPVTVPASGVEHAMPEGAWRDVQDKWGPAGCIPLRGRRFLFFGWAAS